MLFGGYRGTSQTRLFKMVEPPKRAPFVSPVILWLVIFFPLMAFVGRGSTLIAIIAVGYIALLPSYLLAALFYNF